MTKQFAFLTILSCFSPVLAYAGNFTVHGDAEIKVTPDEAKFSFEIETKHKDVVAAQKKNDEQLQKILALLPQFHVDPKKHIQTNYLSILPHDEYEEDRKTHISKMIFKGYQTSRRLTITVKDMNQFEPLIVGLLQAGINNISSVEFCSSELSKYKNQARTMAVRAAKEKALVMTKELNQPLGKAQTIEELQDGWSYSGRNNFNLAYNDASAKAMSNGGEGNPSAAEGNSGIGTITVTAKVSIVFQLE